MLLELAELCVVEGRVPADVHEDFDAAIELD